ncbi:uncharacterized protein PHALS_12456 [Plasmopara halstedii]|uniref:Uncharacterized protein n=1 Tax=Plasmopara halstedii TaxID=4781 RepID=A0A0P1ALX6_PLAHL|nr:uncharacterized protein PHALS_12456 [Plasmopara halstedii]CEG42158.1 hypothetical protein PHALS_12456 [Plasmopara halstedii]|eukprot:XP_024578527.1 hypothetical protein PHALS_12456 [Plasmopara halstedii]
MKTSFPNSELAMQVFYFVLATVIACLATSGYSVTPPQAKNTQVKAEFEIYTSTRSLEAAGSYSKDEDEKKDFGKPSFMQKVRFKYWKTMGKTPGDLRREYFDGMSEEIVKQNPNYVIYMRYKAYYDK